jgi:hypothetical protein
VGFIYLPFLGVPVICDAIYALQFSISSGAFFHFVWASAVWAGIFAFALIVFVSEPTAFEASCWD